MANVSGHGYRSGRRANQDSIEVSGGKRGRDNAPKQGAPSLVRARNSRDDGGAGGGPVNRPGLSRRLPGPVHPAGRRHLLRVCDRRRPGAPAGDAVQGPDQLDRERRSLPDDRPASQAPGGTAEAAGLGCAGLSADLGTGGASAQTPSVPHVLRDPGQHFGPALPLRRHRHHPGGPVSGRLRRAVGVPRRRFHRSEPVPGHHHGEALPAVEGGTNHRRGAQHPVEPTAIRQRPDPRWDPAERCSAPRSRGSTT